MKELTLKSVLQTEGTHAHGANPAAGLPTPPCCLEPRNPLSSQKIFICWHNQRIWAVLYMESFPQGSNAPRL